MTLKGALSVILKLELTRARTGFANFTDIKITNFHLPGDDPDGGISLYVETELTNPRYVAVAARLTGAVLSASRSAFSRSISSTTASTSGP